MTPNTKKLPALEDDPAWRAPIDWGVETDASKVDEYLYGVVREAPDCGEVRARN